MVRKNRAASLSKDKAVINCGVLEIKKYEEKEKEEEQEEEKNEDDEDNERRGRADELLSCPSPSWSLA